MRTSGSKSRLAVADNGYTLMELLVVLAILGLLTAIATPYAIHYLENAKVRTAKAEIGNISTGLDLFRLDVGRYPTTEEGLPALVQAPSNLENWNGPYMKRQGAFNDPWGKPYLYRSPGEHGEFDLYTYGSKTESSTGKPVAANW